MAVNDNNRDDGLERDPRIARLLEAAGGEEPPAALDAAILAAARRGSRGRRVLVQLWARLHRKRRRPRQV